MVGGTRMKKKNSIKCICLTLVLFLGVILAFTGIKVNAAEERTVEGILICGNCKGAGAVGHSINCTLMSTCQKSGYGVLIPQEDKTYKFYAFDDAGDAIANSLLKNIKAAGAKNYVSVTVKGLFSDIPGTYTYDKDKNIEFNGEIRDVSISYDPTHIRYEANASEFTDKIQVSEVANQSYSGYAIEPKVEIKDGDYTLKQGSDYILSYTNNTDPGKATIDIIGVGAFYKGKIQKSFIIEGQVLGAKDLNNEAEVEKVPVKNEQIEQINKNDEETRESNIPETGDNMNLWVYSGLILSVMAFGTFLFRKKEE